MGSNASLAALAEEKKDELGALKERFDEQAMLHCELIRALKSESTPRRAQRPPANACQQIG